MDGLPPPSGHHAPGHHPGIISFGWIVRLILPWFVMALTLVSLGMLNWFVVTEMRSMRESMRFMYIVITQNQKDIMVRLERIESKWERFERDGYGRDQR